MPSVSRRRNTSKIAGVSTELTYTPEELSEDRVVLVGRNDTATSTETEAQLIATLNGLGQ